MSFRRPVVALLLAVVLLGAGALAQTTTPTSVPVTALAPWPGHETIENDWCRVRFESRHRHLAISVLADAGAARAKVRARLGRAVPTGVTVDIVEAPADLARRVHAITGTESPHWAAAVAFAPANLVVLRADACFPMDEKVSPLLLHEFAHLAIGRAEDGNLSDRRNLPRWFEEGIAQWTAGAPKPREEPDLRPAALFNNLADLATLEASFLGGENAAVKAYAEARSRVSHLAKMGGWEAPKKVLAAVLDNGLPMEEALRLGTGYPPSYLEQDWRDSLKSDLSWVPGLLGQFVFVAIIVVAVVLGMRKISRLRRRLFTKWDDEERRQAEALNEVPPPPTLHG